MFDCYSHITSYVSQVFTSCTHYTSYSLLNFVYIIVCVFGLTNQVWKFLEFYAKHIWCLREWIENLNFGKTGFKTCVFEKHFILYSCMWFIKFNALRSFCFILLCFSKIWFFQIFNRSNLLLDWSKLKIFQFRSVKHRLNTNRVRQTQTLNTFCIKIKEPIILDGHNKITHNIIYQF